MSLCNRSIQTENLQRDKTVVMDSKENLSCKIKVEKSYTDASHHCSIPERKTLLTYIFEFIPNICK